MILVSYTVDDRDAQRFFDYAGYKSRDMREPFERVLRFIRSFETEVFNSEGETLLGGKWEELTPKYAKRKLEEVGPKPILQYSDDLFLQAISAGEAHVESLSYSVEAISEKGFDYGEAHMEGTSKMVERPWFAWTEDHEEYTQYVFEEWLDELRAANARRGDPDPGIRPQPPTLSHMYEGIF